MEAALRARSEKIRKPGEYIGFLEWVIWGHMLNKRVLMLFGSTVKDVIETFAPGVGAANPDEPWGVARVAAVMGTGVPGQWLAAEGSLPHINHYVIGVCFRRVEAAAPIDPASCAKRAAFQIGWVLKPTVADGNCGPDVMADNLQLPRNMETWTAIRESIADFMLHHAHQEAWQEVATACQEAADASSGPDPKGGLGQAPVPALAFGGSLGLPAPSSPAAPKPGVGAALDVPEPVGEDSSESDSCTDASDGERSECIEGASIEDLRLERQQPMDLEDLFFWATGGSRVGSGVRICLCGSAQRPKL